MNSQRLFFSLSALLLAGCIQSELEIPTNHPGHSGATPGQQPFQSDALSSRYDVQLDMEEAPAPEAHSHEAAAAEASAYTCPMHPEVVSKTPGDCPICGMKLVPRKEQAP